VKAVPFRRGGTPWRGESPGELRAWVGLNNRPGVADSRVEQSPEGEGAPGPVSETVWMQVASVSCHRLWSVFFGFGRRSRAVERTVVGFGRLRCA
jgi:hypothetical protein